MPHSCHQLSALLTAPVARGGLPPANCPLQEDACLHSADWECPGLPCWPLPLLRPPPSPHSFSLLPLFFCPLSYSLSAPPSVVLVPSRLNPSVVLWSAHSGTGGGAALRKPRQRRCKSVVVFTGLPWASPGAMVGLSGGWSRFAAYSQGRSNFCSAYRRSKLPLNSNGIQHRSCFLFQ